MSDGSGILIKPEQLSNAAQVLRESAKKVQASIDEVDEQFQSLGPTRFEGVSADTIRARYAKRREKFYQFKPFIESFVRKLESIAADFTKVDNMTGK